MIAWGLQEGRRLGAPRSEHCGLDTEPGFLAWQPTLPSSIPVLEEED